MRKVNIQTKEGGMPNEPTTQQRAIAGQVAKEAAKAQTQALVEMYKKSMRANLAADLHARFEAGWAELTKRRTDIASDDTLKQSVRNVMLAGFDAEQDIVHPDVQREYRARLDLRAKGLRLERTPARHW